MPALTSKKMKDIADKIDDSVDTRPPAEVAPERVTIVCDDCGFECFQVNTERLKEAAQDDRRVWLTSDDLEYVGKIKVRKRTHEVPVDCPRCAYDVFMRRYNGGYSVRLKEFGEVPRGNKSFGVGVRSVYRLDASGRLRSRWIKATANSNWRHSSR